MAAQGRHVSVGGPLVILRQSVFQRMWAVWRGISGSPVAWGAAELSGPFAGVLTILLGLLRVLRKVLASLSYAIF